MTKTGRPRTRFCCIECGAEPVIMRTGRCREHWNIYMRLWRKRRTIEYHALKAKAALQAPPP